MDNNRYIDINTVAKAKGLKSTRSIRIAINNNKYIARKIRTQGGETYEILYSSLEPELQSKIEDEEIRCTALVPVVSNDMAKPNFISESAKLTALARVDIVEALNHIRNQYKTKKEADLVFLDLYNSGLYLQQVYKFIGSISVGTLHRFVKAYENGSDYRALIPNYKYVRESEYNTKLTEEMKDIFIKYLLHPNKFNIGKSISLTKHILEKRGIEYIPCDLTFRRFAEYYKKHNYSKWILMREGEKAYHDKVEAYIERDISLL